jgi:hypothetical protein
MQLNSGLVLLPTSSGGPPWIWSAILDYGLLPTLLIKTRRCSGEATWSKETTRARAELDRAVAEIASLKQRIEQFDRGHELESE